MLAGTSTNYASGALTMLIALLAGLAMFVGDILEGLYILLLDKGRATLAGFFEGLGDLTQIVSIGGGASELFSRHDYSAAVLAFGLILLGSVLGARVAERFTGERSKMA